jgi:transcriptional regulator with PAS, ATPase and Fis domain
LEEIAEHKYTRSILELLHTGISIMDAEGYFLYSNKAFLEMFDLPNDVRGKHVCDFFLTGEQGVMAAIRTRKMNMHSSITTGHAQGASFRYPVMDQEGKLLGIIIESISTKIDKEKLLTLLDTLRNLEKKVEYFDQRAHATRGTLYSFDDFIGESDVMEAMKQRGRHFARSDEPILLLGESGTGKELIAQALHSASPRAEKPFVTVNCAALPPDLMDTELFGYGTGAFTGAKSGGMQGKFELADKGTILLDEIGDIPLPLQAKLLRVLETGEIQKIAYPKPLQSDFRLIAATNKNLAQLVNEGRFREDLYHRLNILELTIAPLREHTTDIPLLTRNFILHIVGFKRAREIIISNELYRVFGLHPWGGNVRELKNVLTFALLSLDPSENILKLCHLPESFLRELHNDSHEVDDGIISGISNLTKAGASAERTTLMRVLTSTQYNKTRAAHVLGISRNKLYKKMREFGLHQCGVLPS